MAKFAKLKQRFLSDPKDFTWDELVRLMQGLGFSLDQSGGGSHCRFVLKSDASIIVNAFRPHPDGTLRRYQIREIRNYLQERGLIS